MNPEPRMQTVLKNRKAIGFLLATAKGVKPFDADGEPLGLWQNEQDAARAVYKEANVA